MAIRALFQPWYTDRLSAVTTKDAASEMAGVWGIEAAEMETIHRATTGAAKSFISRQYDRYRPPYARHLVDQPRQSILFGTINPPNGGYLKDPTGARRSWPFACDVIGIDALARDRDQLWAEAVVRFKDGAPWWLETSKLEQLAAVEQAARYKADIWEEPIKEALDDREIKVTSVPWLLEHVLGLNPKKTEPLGRNARCGNPQGQAGLLQAPSGGRRQGQGQGAQAQIRILAAVIVWKKVRTVRAKGNKLNEQPRNPHAER